VQIGLGAVMARGGGGVRLADHEGPPG
jgi:hypothetical protein